MKKSTKIIVLWLFIFFSTLLWSLIKPQDILIWFLEAFPAVAGLIILFLTYRNFKFTNLIYWLILIHSVILFIGAHYTYAEVPMFNWLRDTLDLSRNHYDKIGHFVQGFIPAMIARELLIRTSPLKAGKWLSFIVLSICLAISAFYELIEWWTAVIAGPTVEDFLGTQGYIWDTQSDMALALAGAAIALLLFSRYHNRLMSEHFGISSR